MNSFTQALREKILLFDGAMGTMLQQKNLLKTSHCPESLNESNPAAIEDIHRSYLEAGADVTKTNTFGSNSCKLGKFGLSSRAAALTAAGVACARRAVSASGKNAFVAVSVSSTGELLAPFGPLSPDAACAAFREQIAAAADAGADLVLIETMTDVAEARLAMLMAKEVCSLPIAVSLSYEANGYTLMGNPPDVAAHLFSALGASMLGINCSGGAHHLLPTFQRLKAATRLPLLAMPNAGLPTVADGKTVFPETPQTFAQAIKPFLSGASALGGCCGTTPDHIREVRALLDHAALPATGTDTPQPCSARVSIAPESMKNAPLVKCAGPDALDTLLDMQDEAVVLDVGDMPCSEIITLLDTALPLLGGKPLGFVLHEAQQSRALLHYPGIAAVAGDKEACAEAARLFGAVCI